MSEPQSPRRGIVLGTQKAAAPAASGDEPIIKSVTFPADRVYRWTAGASEAPDVALVVTQEVMLAVNQHVSESLAREIGGFLLGNRCHCPVTQRDYVIIDQFSPAAGTEATSVSVAFTAESWGKLSEELRGKFLGKFLVGWYHSHPKMSVFLSEHDVQIHEQRFSDDWMSALVLEPQKHLGGFFSRRKGRLDPNVVVEFYELLPPSRETVMPWKNYACHDPLTNQDLDPPRSSGLPVAAAGTSTGQELEPSHQTGQVSEPFPSERTYHWVPAAAAANPPLEEAMVISQEVLEGVNRCVSASLEIEIGGFLLGNRYRCPNSGRNYVIIDQYSPAQFTEATGVSLSFTPEAWGKLHDELRGKFLGKLLVGWYHSHPRMGIFLSSWDVILHDQRFSEPWMSALVIDPEKQEGGLFCRVSGRLDPRVPVDFYEYVAVAGGPSVIRWQDHSCRDQATEHVVAPPRVAAAVGRAELQVAVAPKSVASAPVTPTEYARRPSVPAGPRPSQPNPLAILIAIGTALIVIILIGALFFYSDLVRMFWPPTLTVTAAPQLAETGTPEMGVKLGVAITNAPKGAKVYFNGALVLSAVAPGKSNLIITDNDSVLIRQLKQPATKDTRRDLQIDLRDQTGRKIAMTSATLPPEIFAASVPVSPSPPPAPAPEEKTVTLARVPPPVAQPAAIDAVRSDLTRRASDVARDIKQCVAQNEGNLSACAYTIHDAKEEVFRIRQDLPHSVSPANLNKAIDLLGGSFRAENFMKAADELDTFAKQKKK